MKDYLIIYTTISSDLMKKTLFKGFSIAFLGITTLLYGAVFAPLPTLTIWGGGLFLLSLGLIAIGLLPYRRLSRLQLKPNKLCLINTYTVIYLMQENKILTLPLQTVEQFKFISHPTCYGIAIWFKKETLEPVIVPLEQKKIVDDLRHKGKKMANADLFLPYFNQRALNELNNWKEEDQSQEDEFDFIPNIKNKTVF